MPWSTSNRRERLPHNWQALRLKILRRDHYACQMRDAHGRKCLRPANQCDHIIAGDDHSEANLQALCAWHHARKSSAEGNAVARPSRHRPEEIHPADR